VPDNDSEQRRKQLNEILIDPASTPVEREEAERELFGESGFSLLGSHLPAQNVEHKPDARVEPEQSSSEGGQPSQPAREREKVNPALEAAQRRLAELLAGAPTTVAELVSYLNDETKVRLGIGYDTEMRLRRLLDEAITAKTTRESLMRMFDPVMVGNRQVFIDPWLKQELEQMRARGIAAIKACKDHSGERCPCWWTRVRHELIAFQNRHGAGSDEAKLAEMIWAELEQISREHKPPRAEADSLNGLIASVDLLAERIEENSWRGKRRR